MFSLQGKDASKPAGDWFQLLMFIFTKECLPTSVLCFIVPFFRLFLAVQQRNKFNAEKEKAEFLCRLRGTSASCWARSSVQISAQYRPWLFMIFFKFSYKFTKNASNDVTSVSFPHPFPYIIHHSVIRHYTGSLFDMATISCHFLSAHLSYDCIPLSRPPTRTVEVTDVSCQLK